MWTQAKCDSCGWVAKNIMTAIAESGECPYCGELKLRPL